MGARACAVACAQRGERFSISPYDASSSSAVRPSRGTRRVGGFVLRSLPVNLLVFNPSEVDVNGCVRVTDRRARHLRSVLGVTEGRRLRAGITDGRLGVAEVVEDRPTGILLRLELTDQAPPPPPVRLVLALLRPKVLSRVLQSVAALGVSSLNLVNAWRVEKSYFESPKLSAESIAADLWLGAEQSGNPRIPRVEIFRRFVPFVAERLGLPAQPGAELRLLAHPGAEAPIERFALGSEHGSTIVAVGPEGGWIEPELSSLREVGFLPVRVGDRVLKVESAVTSMLSQLELVRRLNRGP